MRASTRVTASCLLALALAVAYASVSLGQDPRPEGTAPEPVPAPPAPAPLSAEEEQTITPPAPKPAPAPKPRPRAPERDEPRRKPRPKRREKPDRGEPRGRADAPGGEERIEELELPRPSSGVPNIVISRFRIPPFLLPIYQAAGIQYGIRWEVLAAINEIETDYGRNLNVSSAGALGWMQFIRSSWRRYGVDANRDGKKDPYNPVDAIFAAARYLKAAGYRKDARRAIFAYNHADWYVDSVILRARAIAGLPADLVGSLTGLTQGYFPVYARAYYEGGIDPAKAARRPRGEGNPARVLRGSGRRTGIRIHARRGAPVVAVNDGVIRRIGESEEHGLHVVLEDVYGTRFTYSHLGRLAKRHPVPKLQDVSEEDVAEELGLPDPDADAGPTARKALSERAASESRRSAPSRPASTTPKGGDAPSRAAADAAAQDAPSGGGAEAATREAPAPARTVPASKRKKRMFAHPRRPAAFESGGDNQLGLAPQIFNPYLRGRLDPAGDHVVLRRLRRGSRVIAGTVLGRIGTTAAAVPSAVQAQPPGPPATPAPEGGEAAAAAAGSSRPSMYFEIRPPGRRTPRIDPKPILDGWRLLDLTAIYRVAKSNPLLASASSAPGAPSIGQILLMSKETLERRVLANDDIDIYDCGREDIRSGRIDRRVLGTLEFLAAGGMKPTVTSLICGHGTYTKSGNVSHHSSGDAVDISALSGTPVLGNQERGGLVEQAIRRLLTLQGAMRPDQIISLLRFEDADNTFAMGDHADHLHVGWRPVAGASGRRGSTRSVLEPEQWLELTDRLSELENPVVRRGPSRHALEAER